MPLCQPGPLQPVWNIMHEGRTLECALRLHGEYGWEVVLSSNGREMYGRRFVLRADALVEAAELLLRFPPDR